MGWGYHHGVVMSQFIGKSSLAEAFLAHSAAPEPAFVNK